MFEQINLGKFHPFDIKPLLVTSVDPHTDGDMGHDEHAWRKLNELHSL